MPTLTGLDVAVRWLRGGSVDTGWRETAQLLRRGRTGLVTNPSAATRDLVAAPDILRAAGANLQSLFGPEHGVRGDVPDGVKIPHGVDPRTGVRLWSLYGTESRPTPEMLKGLDVLVFDIQDVGARFYTYQSTLSNVMESAKGAGLPVVIFDRPNPLGGDEVEGPMLEPAHRSFVGLHRIPIRHGATMGELGRLWAGFGAGDPPTVVLCEGWKRRDQWERTGLQWIPPSPNMPTPETALVYPGLCLIEGTNVSEARGTAAPFRWFGAPWIAPEELADALNGEGLPGVRFRPQRFQPSASKHQGQPCSGCQVHVLDAKEFRPVATGYAVLSALRRLYARDFAWRENAGRFSVDRLAGSSSLREAVNQGRPWREVSRTWETEEKEYRQRLHEVRLYE